MSEAEDSESESEAAVMWSASERLGGRGRRVRMLERERRMGVGTGERVEGGSDCKVREEVSCKERPWEGRGGGGRLGRGGGWVGEKWGAGWGRWTSSNCR